MINGAEDLFGINGGKTKYKIPYKENGDINYVHTIYHTAYEGVYLTPYEAFALILEQQIGQDLYKRLLDFRNSILDTVKAIDVYQKDKQYFDDLQKQIKDVDAKILSYEEDIQVMSETINKLDNSKLKIMRELIEQLESAKTEKTKLELQTKNIDSTKAQAFLDTFNAQYEELKHSLTKEEIQKIKKFKDESFKQEIVQDYVDTMLLPGDTKKEPAIRAGGKAMFAMFDMEMDSILMTLKTSTDLIEEIKENGIDSKLSKDVKNEVSLIKSVKNVSTDILEMSNKQIVIHEKPAKYFSLIAQKMQSTKYFRDFDNSNVEVVAELRSQAKKFDIEFLENKTLGSKMKRFLRGGYIQDIDFFDNTVFFNIYKMQQIQHGKQQNADRTL